MASMNGAPVPVPKASLFKASIDPTKAKVKTAPKGPSELPMAPGQALPSPVVKMVKAQKAEPAGVPLIKATVVPVLIPYVLAQSIANKPTTGGGWQAIMGDLQAVLAPSMPQGPGVPEASHILNLTPYLLAKLVDKATAHGTTGGYQGILKSIVCLAVKQHPGKILGGGGT